jgi:chromosome segregation ATPase
VAQGLLRNVEWDLRASEGDCVALETKIEEVTEELVKSHEKCTKVQKGLTKAESDLKDRTKQIRGLQQDVGRLRQEAEKFNGQMSVRHEELRSLRNNLGTASSDISQERRLTTLETELAEQ